MTSLQELAQLVNGQLMGDGTTPILGAATLSDVALGQITLVDCPERAAELKQSPAVAAVIPSNFPLDGLAIPTIQVADVHQAFTAIILHYRPLRKTVRQGISNQAVVSSTAQLGSDVEVQPFATIGEGVRIGNRVTIHSGARIMHDCEIGDDVTILPNAVLYENTIVGARTVIHAGVVIGAHGFGYRTAQGKHASSAQLGNVVIGSDVEIGPNSTIDRGTYGPTTIGEGTKIDDQVMIAHNCTIGKHNLLCSQVGIAGSSSTGDYVVMAGQVGVRDHVHVGAGALLGGKAGVTNDVPDGAHYFGAPAIPAREMKIQFAALSKLPELRKQIKALQQTVDALVAGSNQRSSDRSAA
jgi:UDP-3-O-[3-hydroxymyristoyl] glucosamine N-acyltransferase